MTDASRSGGRQFRQLRGSLRALVDDALRDAARAVHVAERDGQRVGGVVRRRRDVEPEQQPHHVLHLLLFRAPVADDRALDLGRRVLHDLHAGLHRRQHRDAARVPELERAAHVDRVEQVLDGDQIGAACRR